MDWLFKLLGLLFLFSAAALMGFSKSLLLKKRQKKLERIYRSLSDLRERIRLGAGEVSRLVNMSFGNDTAVFTYGGIKLNGNYLDKSDVSLLVDFFSDIGMSDTESEYERTGLYMELIKKKCDEAEQKCNELCKLYNTLGVLCGVFICIFFI